MYLRPNKTILMSQEITMAIIRHSDLQNYSLLSFCSWSDGAFGGVNHFYLVGEKLIKRRI